MKKVILSLLLALACVGLCATIVNLDKEKSYVKSSNYHVMRSEAHNEIDNQILKQLKVKDVLKHYKVTNDDVQEFRDSLAASEDDRASTLREEFATLKTYEMSTAQKKALNKQLAQALRYNKKLYNDTPFVKEMLAQKNRAALKKKLNDINASNSMDIVYNLKNIATGEVFSNETSKDKPSKYVLNQENEVYYLGVETHGEDYDIYNLLPERYQTYEGHIYVPEAMYKTSTFYNDEQSYNKAYQLREWLQWIGLGAFVGALALWIKTRREYRAFGRSIEIQFAGVVVILFIGAWLGLYCANTLFELMYISHVEYVQMTIITIVSAILIYILLSFVHSIVYCVTRREWGHSWLYRNRMVWKNSFYVPRHSFFLLFTWFAFFLAGIGWMIVMTDSLLSVGVVYLVLWCVVMVPTMVFAWRQMAATNTVIRQAETKAPAFEGQYPLAMHSAQIASLAKGIDESYAEQQKSERMKTELITNVSHDLRTPLTAMMTYTDLLKNPALTEEERAQYVDVLDLKTQKLKGLIDDLFDVSKMASGQVELHRTTIDYVQMLQQLVGEHQELADAKHLTIRTQFDVDSYMLNVDPAKWARMIDNLIGNAVKYSTPDTRIHVQLSNGTLTIKNVTAYELPEDLDELMDRFARGDASRHTEGSGLGLAIAQSIANLHGTAVSLQVDGDLFKATVKAP